MTWKETSSFLLCYRIPLKKRNVNFQKAYYEIRKIEKTLLKILCKYVILIKDDVINDELHRIK